VDNATTIAGRFRHLFCLRTWRAWVAAFCCFCVAPACSQDAADEALQLRTALSKRHQKISVDIEDGRWVVQIECLSQEDLPLLAEFPVSTLIATDATVNDLIPLTGLPLKEIVISRCPGLDPLRGIDALTNRSLVVVSLINAGLADVAPICVLTNLQSLSLDGSQLLSCIRPLAYLPLRHLSLSSTAVSDISVLRGMPLAFLNLSHTPVSNINALVGMPLRSLDISFTHVASLNALRGMPISDLRFSGTPVRDVSALRQMPLDVLMLNGSAVSDISPLAEAPLTYICFSPEQVTNGLACLQRMQTLRTIAVGWKTSEQWSAEEFWKRSPSPAPNRVVPRK
jgi:hypothetical protein